MRIVSQNINAFIALIFGELFFVIDGISLKNNKYRKQFNLVMDILQLPNLSGIVCHEDALVSNAENSDIRRLLKPFEHPNRICNAAKARPTDRSAWLGDSAIAAANSSGPRQSSAVSAGQVPREQ